MLFFNNYLKIYIYGIFYLIDLPCKSICINNTYNTIKLVLKKGMRKHINIIIIYGILNKI